MTNYLCAPPGQRIIPVTRGADRSFTVRRTDSTGAPLDYAAGTAVSLWVDIDRDPTEVQATVTGPSAAFTIGSAVCDLVKSSTRWRIIVARGGTEVPVLVGRFERRDG